MTTIAYRNGVMAADSAIFDRGCHVGECVKIFRAPSGIIGGAAGCLGDLCALRDWILGDCDGKPPEFGDEDSEGLVVHPTGVVEWIGPKQKRIEHRSEFHVIGSGFRIAMGAMHMGATAFQAVEIAAKLDSYTRGPITTIGLGE
jgi:hypothetical protein